MSPLSRWIPYRLLLQPEQPLCRWLYTGQKPFTEPFFDDTIHICRGMAASSLHVASGLSLLPSWSETIPTTEPAAFIFHISRCGSTLLAQLLGMDPENIALAEVPFFDEILRAPYRQQEHPPFSQPDILRAAIRFYGQVRLGPEKRCIVKTDSWHIFFYKMLRDMYPGIPFILLYRKPAEVIRSHQKQRGMQAVPGVIEKAIFGFDDNTTTHLDEYMALVMEKYLSLFLEISSGDKHTLLVNYHEGMLNVALKTAQIAGLRLSGELLARMEERCRYHAKYPKEIFSEPAAKEAPPAYLQPCLRLYEELEQRRMVSAR